MEKLDEDKIELLAPPKVSLQFKGLFVGQPELAAYFGPHHGFSGLPQSRAGVTPFPEDEGSQLTGKQAESSFPLGATRLISLVHEHSANIKNDCSNAHPVFFCVC